jgi:hypothetical protein
MTLTPPIISPPVTINQDEEHLRLLGIFWYIFSALRAFVALMLMLYLGIALCLAIFGVAAGAAAASSSHDPSDKFAMIPIAFFGLFFIALFAFILLWTLLFAFLDYKVGQSLKLRKNITLCYIMAGIMCLSVPFGLALGIFTFVVLSRPSVKATFT